MRMCNLWSISMSDLSKFRGNLRLSYLEFLGMIPIIDSKSPSRSVNSCALLGSVHSNGDLDATSSELAIEFDDAINESANLLLSS